MGKRFYTIFMVPDKAAKVQRFRLPEIIVKAGGAAMIVLLFFSIFSVSQYAQLKQKQGEAKYFKSMVQNQKLELEKFTDKVGALEGQMERLRQVERKLRGLMSLDRPEGAGERSGRGSISLEGQERPDLPGLTEQERRNRIIQELERLEEDARIQEKRFSEIEGLAEKRRALLAARPSIGPTSGAITSPFGRRQSPFTDREQMHEGVDIANRMGTPIVATADGTVSFVGSDQAQGRVIVIDHGFDITTSYGHVDKMLVKVGDKVKRGQKIATMGNSGLSTGPHLHYEVRLKGAAVNPKRYMPN